MENEELKHYVEFFFEKNLANFCYENSVKKIESRDSEIILPENAFAYRIFDRQEAKAKNGEVLKGQPINYSGKFYIGRLISLEEIKKEFPYEKSLVDVVKRNVGERKGDKVIKTKYTFQVFEKGDKILD